MSIRRCILLLALMGVGLLWIPGRSIDADDWLPITPEELKMTSEPLAPGAPAIYLYRQVDRNDSFRAATEYNYFRIKVLAEEGRKYANVEIPFQKQRTSISGIRARTIRPDGTIAEFDGKVYEQTVEKTKGIKILVKAFSLPDVQVGSIIEYHFNVDFEDRYIFSSLWILSEELFTKRAQFTLKPYNRDQWIVQWTWPAGLPKDTAPPKEGSDSIVRMSTQNIPAFIEEDHMPPPDELKFRVQFVYHEEMPEKDPDKYWKHFGKKADDRVENFVNKRKAMEEAVAGTITSGDAPDVKLQKIYARVQQIRNLSYELRKTQQENKRDKMKEITSVEDLWKNQYGSGWDLTWLFLGMARAAGFEAYPCLVSARNEYFFRKERINGGELDANVVLVKLNGKDLYFDPGAAFTPYGLLPWMETGVAGLKLDKDGGTWIQTPLPGSDESRIERTATLRLSSEGALEGKLKVTYVGLEALRHRVAGRNEDDTERKKSLEEEVQGYIPAGSELELTNKPEWNGASPMFVAEFDVKIPGWAASAGRRVLLATGLFGGSEKHICEHASRVWPVYFRYPFKTIDDLTIELPPDWKISDTPKPVDQDLKAAEYLLKVENVGGKLHIQRVLRSDLMMIPVDHYSTLRSFFQLVRTEDEQQIILQPGQSSASN